LVAYGAEHVSRSFAVCGADLDPVGFSIGRMSAKRASSDIRACPG
jgi:hypothetical protein